MKLVSLVRLLAGPKCIATKNNVKRVFYIQNYWFYNKGFYSKNIYIKKNLSLYFNFHQK